MRRFVYGCAMLTIATCLPMAAKADQQQDKQIAQQVIQRLQTEKTAGRLKGFNIDLQVENGTLWLSGRVTSKEQQDKALDIARRVPGVKQVVNDISIAAPAVAKAPTPVAKPTVQAQPQVALVANTVARPVARPNYLPEAAPAVANQTPVAMAPARTVNYQQAASMGQPQPMMMPGSGVGVAPVRYDHPQMPGYAWPSYASHPNYAAVTYPKQYSASAWPYIGPFYPYPQVPLGWRKVSLEWDDGWWYLDFKDRSSRR